LAFEQKAGSRNLAALAGAVQGCCAPAQAADVIQGHRSRYRPLQTKQSEYTLFRRSNV
jgi:hypothetical protein